MAPRKLEGGGGGGGSGGGGSGGEELDKHDILSQQNVTPTSTYYWTSCVRAQIILASPPCKPSLNLLT